MLRVFINVEASRPTKLVYEPGTPQVHGYYQQFGVTAPTYERLRELVEDYLKQDAGSRLLQVVQVWAPDFDGHDKDIHQHCKDMTRPGIWYASGRAFFWADHQPAPPPEQRPDGSGSQ